MFLKEKLKIWFTRVFRSFRFHFIFWNSALFFYVFITGNQSLFVNYFNLLTVDSIYTNTIFLAVSIAFLFTFLDILFSDRVMRFSPIRSIVFLRSLLYFVVALVILYLAVNKSITLEDIKDYKALLARMPAIKIEQGRFLAYFYLSCIISNSFKEMHKKIGVSNFFNWFFGSLNKPREEEKIFMFIDMKSSTTIAENIKHVKFSRLVQDVFNDMSVLYNYGGEIYNYLGDGAVVTWDKKRGVRNFNCLKAFFAFSRVIKRRSRYYRRRYGVVPEFKAGLHLGDVMVLQVGTIRRDISYNGDTINTAARIESKCNEFKQDLLISGVLYESFDDKKVFNFKRHESFSLKGKKNVVEIYSVREKSKSKTKKRK